MSTLIPIIGPARHARDSSIFLPADIQALEPRPRKRDVDPCCIKNLLARWNTNGKVRILRQPSDEKHETVRFDLQLGEIGAAHRQLRMFGQRLLVRFENGGDSFEAVGEGARVLGGGCDMRHHGCEVSSRLARRWG